MSKVLKFVGIGCGGCLGLVLLLALGAYFLAPDGYEVERSIEIEAPPPTVYGLVASSKRWKDWDAWSELDPSAERTYSGPETGEGSSYSWNSDHPDVGVGTLTVVRAVPHERIEIRVDLETWDMTSNSVFELERVASGTRITWTDSGDLEGAMKLFGLVMDAMLGEQLEKGLANLKVLAEREVDVGDVLLDKADEIVDEVFEGLGGGQPAEGE